MAFGKRRINSVFRSFHVLTVWVRNFLSKGNRLEICSLKVGDIDCWGQFHQHFMHAFFVRKSFEQIFSAWSLALNKLLYKNVRIKSWRYWLQVSISSIFYLRIFCTKAFSLFRAWLWTNFCTKKCTHKKLVILTAVRKSKGELLERVLSWRNLTKKTSFEKINIFRNKFVKTGVILYELSGCISIKSSDLFKSRFRMINSTLKFHNQIYNETR